MDTTKPSRLVLVDGSGYIFRAYHALPPLTRPDGTPVGAVYGFTTMLMKLRDAYRGERLAVIFDASRRSFRHDLYPQYKANRPPAPEDLVPQFPLTRTATQALNLPAIELEDFEADDLIASYAHAARAQGQEVVIVSSDKDLMQLVGDGVTMFDPMKNREIGPAQVIEKFGVPPAQVTQVQALIGDAVDHVPGVPGIGPKTAAELIVQFGSLEALLAAADAIKQPKRRESLLANAQAARLSLQLVTLRTDTPLPVPLKALPVIAPPDTQLLTAFLQTQGFSSLLKKLGGEAVAPRATLPAASADHPAAAPGVTALAPRVDAAAYVTIREAATLTQWVDQARRQPVVAIDTETTSLQAFDATLVGISLAIAPGMAAYIPLRHVTGQQAAATLFEAAAEPTLQPGQMAVDEALALLRPLLADPAVLKVGHNVKYDLTVLAREQVEVSPVGDTMLMSYSLGGGRHAQGLDFLTQHYFSHRMIAFSEVTGSGKAQKNFSQVEIDAATRYAAEDADFTLRLYHALHTALIEARLTRVYETLERPLIGVIARMEQAGIAVDAAALAELSREFAQHLQRLEEEIIRLAGAPFAVGSPKQLGEVLFEKLQLPGGKKSAKSGAYGTDAGVLEELAAAGHTIAQKVLDWRHFAKLKSTYTDTLPAAASPRDGRVHTSFGMALTTTGRLSSSDPNLQNIPIRSAEGKRIRAAFVASPGHLLLSADYSQIELRLLAHMADISVLKQAFREGADIHAITAAEIFGVPRAQVDSELRRRAKSINFGIIYGISAHGLALQLGIARSEAAAIIERYFARYPGIRDYMERTIATARAQGYVETLYGRRIYLRDILAKNPAQRNFSERAAINAPLQGTAADIIKRAMVAVDALLPRETRLVLQVHDELVVEAPQDQAHALAPQLRRVMEQSAQLSLPLTVDVGIGTHWGEAH